MTIITHSTEATEDKSAVPCATEPPVVTQVAVQRRERNIAAGVRRSIVLSDVFDLKLRM